MIDLRSDTVTKPTYAMREVMANAVVGDDVYADDPTVNQLESVVADVLGKEAAVFVPTGSMSNQIALRTHTEPGDLVVIERRAHIVRSEGGGGAALSGVTMRPLDGVHGVFTPEQITETLGRPHRFNPSTLPSPPTLLCVENTHNGAGGTVWPMDALHDVCQTGRTHGLTLHLDGARLWHASAASGVSERDFAEPFDTVNVCFSKGLGAPIGSALVGEKPFIDRARRFKQQFGGGMRQAGVIAAAALHALEHHRSDLRTDVERATKLAEALAGAPGFRVDLASVQSNIVRFEVEMDAGSFADECYERGVYMLPNGTHGMRAVLHRDLSDGDVDAAIRIMREVVAGLESPEPVSTSDVD
ncbi:MAG: beta-eliminating lyase-related protein [Gemmatimonadota bacterium]|nr:beta-eliminating lyase-related protein [Gemmatimonadota bacterium]MDE3005215.1 beta-eliminating lyase-related protein [Gemmatimonadota bacterium]MDE3014202.1 beta-eliminating lyase-related protein [Gemmatimonadota bacterium]